MDWFLSHIKIKEELLSNCKWWALDQGTNFLAAISRRVAKEAEMFRNGIGVRSNEFS